MFEKTICVYDMEGGVAEAERIWSEIATTHKTRKLSKQAFMDIREVILDYFVSTLKLNAEQKAAYDTLLDFAYEHFVKVLF